MSFKVLKHRLINLSKLLSRVFTSFPRSLQLKYDQSPGHVVCMKSHCDESLASTFIIPSADVHPTRAVWRLFQFLLSVDVGHSRTIEHWHFGSFPKHPFPRYSFLQLPNRAGVSPGVSGPGLRTEVLEVQSST